MSTKTKSIVNGIDLDALGGVVEAVQSDATNGQVGFRVTTTWEGGTRSQARIRDWRLAGETLPRDFRIEADEPTELLGQATAPNPQELLMAGLGACMAVGYVALCALEGIEVTALEIESTADLDLRGFLGLDPDVVPGCRELHYQVRLRADAPAETLQAIHEKVMATSPNFHNLSQPVKLVPELVVL